MDKKDIQELKELLIRVHKCVFEGFTLSDKIAVEQAIRKLNNLLK